MASDTRILISGFQQAWPMPSKPWSITILGAGGIVRDAHLPAYRKMGLPVAGVFDVNVDVAQKLAADFDVPTVQRAVPEQSYDV